MPENAIPIVSLFCGAGGLDWGFRRERFRVVLACDNEKAAVDSYNRNINTNVAQMVDLSVATADDLAVRTKTKAPGTSLAGVIGGPPCQGFSRANASGNPNDPRNLLPFKYAEILAALNDQFSLKFFLFENVLGLLNPRHRDRFQAIQREFEKAGFNVFVTVHTMV